MKLKLPRKNVEKLCIAIRSFENKKCHLSDIHMAGGDYVQSEQIQASHTSTTISHFAKSHRATYE